MDVKPILQISKTTIQKLFDLLGAVIYLAMVIYLIRIWGQLPDQMPGHYDAMGNVDRWGSKWELLVLPVISGFLAIFLTFLEKHPECHNYMNVTEENVEFQYKNSIAMLNVLKNECVILFAYINYRSVQVAIGNSKSLGSTFLPIFLIIVFGTVIIFFLRSTKKR